MKIGVPFDMLVPGDLLACSMVLQVRRFSNVKFMLSSDYDMLNALCSMIIGIGGVYNHAKRHYDCAQPLWDCKWEYKILQQKVDIPLGSAGLIWKHYGKEVIEGVAGDDALDDFHMTFAVEYVYERFVAYFDACQNRIKMVSDKNKSELYEDSSSLAKRIKRLDEECALPMNKFSVNDCFSKGIQIVQEGLIKMLTDTVNAFIPAFDQCLYDYKSRDLDARYFVTDTPFEDVLEFVEAIDNSEPKPLFVISPKTIYYAIAIKNTHNRLAMDYRILFPQAWRGLRDAELRHACKIRDSCFVHASGFLAANGKFEGAEEMIKQAIFDNEHNPQIVTDTK